MHKNTTLLFAAITLILAGGGLLFGEAPHWEYAWVGENHLPRTAPAGTENPPSGPDDITLVFAGDIMLSRSIGRILERENDWSYPFSHVKDFFKSADIAFANMESPVSARGSKQGSIYSFRTDPRAVEGLAGAGFDVLSIANNHIWDYGPAAFRDTLDILSKAGIAPVGGGGDYAKAHEPIIKEVRRKKIAFLAYTDLVPRAFGRTSARPATAFLEKEAVAKDIKNAKAKADFVVVSFHWGDEYRTKRSKKQEIIGRAAIDAGADLVIGHHPHVVQEVEKYKNGVIAYSLGNFVFDQNFSPDTANGLVLKAVLDSAGTLRTEEMSVRFTKDFQPVFVK